MKLFIPSLLLLLFLPGSAAFGPADLNGTWAGNLIGHPTAVFLKERADGRVVGYMPADPSAWISGGQRSGNSVTLEISAQDPGLVWGGTFTGTLNAAGTRITGAFDDGGGPVPVTFRKLGVNLVVENWILVEAGTDAQLSASRVTLPDGSFGTGGFVGKDHCDFIQCADDWDYWNVAGPDHSFGTSRPDSCPLTSQFAGTWNPMDLLLEGSYVVDDCSGSGGGSFFGGKTGYTKTKHVKPVLKLLRDMADALEAESPAWIDALATTYLYDGRTRAMVAADVDGIFAGYDKLEASVTELREIVTYNDAEVNPMVVGPPRITWRLILTGEPVGGGARETVIDLNSGQLDQEDLKWLGAEGNRAVFVGNGFASPFEIGMPILPGDEARIAFGLWPYLVHGGGHPEGHPGWDVEFQAGASVRAAADGTITDIRPNGSFPGQWQITVQHRPGRTTGYDHVASLEPGIVVGAAVSEGDPLGDAGQTGAHSITHFSVRVGTDDACPALFLSAGGQAVLDPIWQTAVYNEEFCEPLLCNDPAVSFPLTRSWLRQSGGLAPEIEFVRLDSTTSDYDYLLKDAGGAVFETGSVSYNTMAVPLSSIDLIPDGGGPTHLGVYDIQSETMRIAWNELIRPTSLAGASVYSFGP